MYSSKGTINESVGDSANFMFIFSSVPGKSFPVDAGTINLLQENLARNVDATNSLVLPGEFIFENWPEREIIFKGKQILLKNVFLHLQPAMR